jgi:pectate lyase
MALEGYEQIPELTATHIGSGSWEWVNTKAQGAFPGAEGYAATTCTHARNAAGAQVLFVTNLNDSGTGSLRWAIEQNFPRVIIFKVSGNITLSSRLEDENFSGNYFVAGQTAPSPGISLISPTGATYGTLVNIRRSQSVWQHIRVRPQHGPPNEVSAVNVIPAPGSTQTDVMLSHLSVAYTTDESIGCQGSNDNPQRVDDQDCLAGFAIKPPSSPDGHILGVIQAGSRSWSSIRQLGLSIRGSKRFPHSAHTKNNNFRCEFTMINNVGFNTDGSIITGMAGANQLGDYRINFVNNLYVPGPDYGGSVALVNLQSLHASAIGGQFYDSGNSGFGHRNIRTGWTEVFSPAFSLPTQVTIRDTSTLESLLTQNNGARPLDRDAIDNLMISDFTNRISRTYTSIPTVPSLAQNVYNHETDSDWTALGLDTPANRFKKDIHPFYSRIELYVAIRTAQVQNVSLIPDV